MKLNLINVSGARKVAGKSLEELTGLQAEGLAYAQAVGTRATAGEAVKQSWKFTAIAAVDLQREHKDVKDRLEAWGNRKVKLIGEVRSSALAEIADSLGMARDVKAGRDPDSKEGLTNLQSLMVKACKLIDNYHSRIADAWANQLLVQVDTLTDGTEVPESAGKLQQRVRDAKAAAAPATPESVIKATAGQFAANITEATKDGASAEHKEAIVGLMNSAYAIVVRLMAGRVSIADVNEVAAQLSTVGGESDETLENIPAESETQDESREAQAA